MPRPSQRRTLLLVVLGGLAFLAGISFVAWHFRPFHRRAEVLRAPAVAGDAGQPGP